MDNVMVNLPDSIAPRRLQELNGHFLIHPNFMPHQIAVAAGCTVQEADQLIDYLCQKGYGKVKWLIYHITHDDVPVAITDQPNASDYLPFICPECELEVTDPKQCFYGRMFFPNRTIQFATESRK